MPGDTILNIDGAEAIDMPLISAKQMIAECGDSLRLGLMRGLYDPVLDDQEPIYEPCEPDALDLQSEPTEVQFPIQHFTDAPDLLKFLEPLEPSSISRSLTASPFVTPTKPYRPFSTEPTPVPPLEDPIILNPDYSDSFIKNTEDIYPDDLLPSCFKDALNYLAEERRFKLPISKQYVPDANDIKTVSKESVKRLDENIAGHHEFDKKLTEISQTQSRHDIVESVSNEVTRETKVLEASNLMDEQLIKDELKYIERMKQEIDLDKIEQTAMLVVDESIERAVSVAEEIKNEMDVELNESKTILETEIHEKYEQVERLETDTNINQTEQNSNESRQEIIEQYDYKEQVDHQEEIAVSDTKHRKSSVYEQSENRMANEINEHNYEQAETIRQEENYTQFSTNDEFKKSTNKAAYENRTTNASSAEQRIYSLGLQTIPNIRGVVHSSYHYNLLLKTFFIHLTDVMVALSRFILSQPVFNEQSSGLQCRDSASQTMQKKDVENQEVFQKSKQTQVMQEKKVEDSVKSSEQVVKSQKYVQQISATKTKPVTVTVSEQEMANNTETKKAKGSSMAQLSEKKLSQDLTQKMDAVVAEFQSKTNTESVDMLEVRKEMIQRNRRSRSRSQIEEEVMRESDPLEWLAKVDSRGASQERTSEMSKKESHSSMSQSTEKKRHETSYESKQSRQCKSPKQTYVAIVESHVYTNKDVIFEEQLSELSETSSVQSADEVNTACEISEAEITENVTIENAVKELETAKVVIEESRKLETGQLRNEATLQIVENIAHDSKELKEEKTEQQHLNVDVNESLSVAESHEIEISDSKQEFTTIQQRVSEAVSVIEKENKEFVAKSEIISDNFIETAREHETVESKQEIKPEYKIVQGEEITETVVIKEKPEKKYAVENEFAELKIVKHMPLDLESTNEIIEIEEVNENSIVSEQGNTAVSKLEMIKQIEVDESQQITEKNITSAHYGSGIQTLSSELVTQQMINKESALSHKASDTQITTNTNELQSKSEENKAQFQTQESSFTAKSVDHKLSLRTDLQPERQTSVLSDENNNTPTPSTVPPTPLVDEYVFSLSMPLPKSRSTTPVPRDCTPSDDDHEDPDIVKKKLVPHIETTIEQVIFDPPLPTPPANKVTSPVYTKPGLRGGSDRAEYHRNKRKEEIREIERKSSLLTSAIDQTIKSIEEYKEEVGMETKKEFKEVKHESYSETTQKDFAETIDVTVKSKAVKQNIAQSKESKTQSVIENSNNSVLKDEHTTGNVKSIEPINGEVDVSSIEDITVSIAKNKSTGNPQQIEDNEPVEVIIKLNKPLNNQGSVGPNVETPRQADKVEEEKSDALPGFRPVVFDPETIAKRTFQPTIVQLEVKKPSMDGRQSPYMTDAGEPIGTNQGIVDGLEAPVIDAEIAKEIGKPGISEDTIAELISGEAEMLREAHVMGLSRVLNSHMHRADDSSVDFEKIKPMIGSLKDSEVLKALNEEMAKEKAEKKKKEERRWTTFLQKPARSAPRPKFGYHGWVQQEEIAEEPYKVKIVKQPKPKVAPDYKPEDFETGPLPWEERQKEEANLPPIEPEEPILVPEVAEILEAVDPTPESEVPDLEDTGIPLPPVQPKEPTPPPEVVEEVIEEPEEKQEVQELEEEKAEPEEKEMENGLADQLVRSVQSMVDPNASLEQQLNQMRAQLAALAQLPEVIQQTLELVSKQLTQITHQEQRVEVSEEKTESYQHVEENTVTEPQETEPQNMTNGVQENHEEHQLVLETGHRDTDTPYSQQNGDAENTMDLKKEKQAKVRKRSSPIRRQIENWNKVWPWADTKSFCRKYSINFKKYEKPPVSLDHLQQSEVYKAVHNMDQAPIKQVELLTPVISEADYRERCRSMTPLPKQHLAIPQQFHP